MILPASLSVIPGSSFNSAELALLMSTMSAFGAVAVLRASEVPAFGVAGTLGAVMVAAGGVVLGEVVAAGCAITGAAIVKANRPIGNRINLCISYLLFEAASSRRVKKRNALTV